MKSGAHIGTATRKVASSALVALTVAAAVVSSPAHAACTAGAPNSALEEATPSSAFTVNSDGTVTHALTGLMWKQCVVGAASALPPCGGSASLPWQAALGAAARDTTGGYTDWRLPNAKELASILETCGVLLSINQTVFPNAPVSPAWTSSTVQGTNTQAWTVDFQFGGLGRTAKTTTGVVRPVRGGRATNTADSQLPNTCTADFDGDGRYDALTDGLLLIRALFGVTGTAVTAGALGSGATRTDRASIRLFMNQHCSTNFSP